MKRKDRKGKVEYGSGNGNYSKPTGEFLAEDKIFANNYFIAKPSTKYQVPYLLCKRIK